MHAPSRTDSASWRCPGAPCSAGHPILPLHQHRTDPMMSGCLAPATVLTLRLQATCRLHACTLRSMWQPRCQQRMLHAAAEATAAGQGSCLRPGIKDYHPAPLQGMSSGRGRAAQQRQGGTAGSGAALPARGRQGFAETLCSVQPVLRHRICNKRRDHASSGVRC